MRLNLDYTDIQIRNIDEIKGKIRAEKEYTCLLPYVDRESTFYLSLVLKSILEEINQEVLFSHLEYILNEISMNASKANSKRLYFNSRGFELENDEDYRKGIVNFKKDVFDDFSKYEQLHIDNESQVRIKFSLDSKNLLLTVSNNSSLIEVERQRINQRLKSAHKFNNLTEVLSEGFDTEEGAGFGLILIVLMLRKLNLNEKDLNFGEEANGSYCSLKIPLNTLSKEDGVFIAEEIAREITQMPQFPESVMALQKELNDPNCSFESIADTVSSDLSLSTEILRIANSPVYSLRDKITDLPGAVRIIGMLGVKSILYNFGVNKLFTKRYNKDVIKEINDHSFHVALLASYLARYSKQIAIAQDVYIAALLHDLGKIIVKTFNKDLEEKLENICTEKHIPISVLDDLTDGFNHSLIGSEIARNWNFPDKFTNVIAFHHLPLEVEEEYKALTYTIYLANEISYLNNGEREYSDLNSHVLKFFGLDEKNAFNRFLESLSAEGLTI